MSEYYGRSSVILDNGSGLCKAGFSGDDGPISIFSCIIGRPLHQHALPGMHVHDNYIGDEAQKRRGILHLKHPMVHGIVTNWDDLEKIWRYVFKHKLHVRSEDFPVLLTEAPHNPVYNRERMVELMFEKFHSPFVFVAIPAVLSLYASGMVTGIVLDSGEGVTHILPIYEGYLASHAVKRIDFGGRDVTTYLERILKERGYTFASSGRIELIREIKETLCFVSMEYEQDMGTSAVKDKFEKSFELPDGEVITIGNERFRCPEVLFRPSAVGKDIAGLHHMLYSSIIEVGEDARKDLWTKVILSGGNTLFQNTTERLMRELKSLAPHVPKVRIIAPPERLTSVWLGGSIIASMPSFRESCISQAEYGEHGPSVIHRKFV